MEIIIIIMSNSVQLSRCFLHLTLVAGICYELKLKRRSLFRRR